MVLNRFGLYALAVFLLLTGLAAKGACSSLEDPFPLQPRAISDALDEHGAQLVILRLQAEQDEQGRSKFGGMLALVAQGKEEWVRVADMMLPDCTLLTREDLLYSMALALPENPSAVVPLLKDNRWPLERICDAPFIEASLETWQNHLIKAQKALDGYNHPEFERERKLCRGFVDWALNRYPKPMPEELHSIRYGAMN